MAYTVQLKVHFGDIYDSLVFFSIISNIILRCSWKIKESQGLYQGAFAKKTFPRELLKKINSWNVSVEMLISVENDF